MWHIADDGDVEQRDGSFPHQRTHTPATKRMSPGGEVARDAEVRGAPIYEPTSPHRGFRRVSLQLI